MKLITTLAAAAVAALTTLAACSSVEAGSGPLALDDTARGCARFHVYVPTTSGRDVVILRAQHDSLNLNMRSRIFNLASVDPSLLSLTLDRFASTGGVDTYCTDVMTGFRPSESWRAVSGSVLLAADTSVVRPGDLYTVSVVFENIRFVSPDGDDERTIDRAEFDSVLVGWYPG